MALREREILWAETGVRKILWTDREKEILRADREGEGDYLI